VTGVPVSRPSPRRALLWAAGLVAVLGAAVVAIWFTRSALQPPEVPVAAIPLTSYPGFERQPSFSPDGNQVAFSWDGEKQDNFDI
jgi:hypothetical protein